MHTTVVVPPAILCRLFGTPKMIRLPAAVGQKTGFACHGTEFVITKFRGGMYQITDVSRGQRPHVGSKDRTIDAIENAMKTGRLANE